MSLLEQAKKLSRGRDVKGISEEHLELVEAWLNDEINGVQLRKVLKISNGVGHYILIANAAKTIFLRKKMGK
jgi:hypothetical protein